MSVLAIEGEMLEVKATQVVTDKFKKREFVVKMESGSGDKKYVEEVLFEAQQDRVDLLDNVKTGDKVNVSFNLKGRSWNNPEGETRYFNTLQAWDIKIV